MKQFNSTNTEVFVYSYKDGLLARLAHDLTMKVDDFTIDFDEVNLKLKAQFNPESLRVQGRSPSETEMIESNIQNEVLNTKEFPTIEFETQSLIPNGNGYHFRGDLSLHGKSQTIEGEILSVGEHFHAEVNLHQPDYGIRPFSAMMGAMKVKPNVKVTVKAKKP